MRDESRALLLAAGLHSTSYTEVRQWCAMLLELCEQLSEENLSASWGSAHYQWVADRAAQWDSGLADRLAVALASHQSLRDAAVELVGECGGSLDPLDNLYRSYAHAAELASQAAELASQAEDPLEYLKDGKYHEFAHGPKRVWVQAADGFLSAEELAEWNVKMAADRLARVWAAAEKRLPKGIEVTPEMRARLSRQLIEQRGVPTGEPQTSTTHHDL